MLVTPGKVVQAPFRGFSFLMPPFFREDRLFGFSSSISGFGFLFFWTCHPLMYPSLLSDSQTFGLPFGSRFPFFFATLPAAFAVPCVLRPTLRLHLMEGSPPELFFSPCLTCLSAPPHLGKDVCPVGTIERIWVIEPI